MGGSQPVTHPLAHSPRDKSRDSLGDSPRDRSRDSLGDNPRDRSRDSLGDSPRDKSTQIRGAWGAAAPTQNWPNHTPTTRPTQIGGGSGGQQPPHRIWQTTHHPHQPHQAHSCTTKSSNPTTHQPHQSQHPQQLNHRRATPQQPKNTHLGYHKTAKTVGGPLGENSSKCYTNGPHSTEHNNPTHPCTTENQHQTPQNTQLETHRQNHRHPLTAKHLAKYSKNGNGARTAPSGFLYLVVFS